MKYESMPQRITMIRYMIPLLMLSLLSTVDASDTKAKSQFTVTYIMLDRLHKQEKDDNVADILPPDDSNATLNIGGEQR